LEQLGIPVPASSPSSRICMPFFIGFPPFFLSLTSFPLVGFLLDVYSFSAGISTFFLQSGPLNKIVFPLPSIASWFPPHSALNQSALKFPHPFDFGRIPGHSLSCSLFPPVSLPPHVSSSFCRLLSIFGLRLAFRPTPSPPSQNVPISAHNKAIPNVPFFRF